MALFQVVANVAATFTNQVTGYGYNSVSGSATTIDVVSNDAHGTVVNPPASAASSYKFGPVALTANQGFSVPLPASPATIGSFTAPSSPATISFTPGAVAVTLNFTGGAFGPVTSKVTCPAPASPTAFATTSVP
jgi:hypothetical protein